MYLYTAASPRDHPISRNDPLPAVVLAVSNKRDTTSLENRHRDNNSCFTYC
jgi:hypothetical protein